MYLNKFKDPDYVIYHLSPLKDVIYVIRLRIRVFNLAVNNDQSNISFNYPLIFFSLLGKHALSSDTCQKLCITELSIKH